MKIRKARPYFEGWYYKHQNGSETVSVIPGAQVDQDGKASAFVQVITNDGSYFVPYDIGSYEADRKKHRIKVGPNRFTSHSMRLSIHTKELSLSGKVKYGNINRLHYDIMGPLRVVPYLPCRHQIVSMNHRLKGKLTLNKKLVSLTGGTGYVEGDCGHTFPKDYFWCQCNQFPNKKCAITAAAATIPVLGVTFRGCFAVIMYKGREIRLATYLGARINYLSRNSLVITQGSMRLQIQIRMGMGQMLYAPVKGRMNARIRENVQCDARYRLFYKGRKILDTSSSYTSFERVMGLAGVK